MSRCGIGPTGCGEGDPGRSLCTDVAWHGVRHESGSLVGRQRPMLYEPRQTPSELVLLAALPGRQLEALATDGRTAEVHTPGGILRVEPGRSRRPTWKTRTRMSPGPGSRSRRGRCPGPAMFEREAVVEHRPALDGAGLAYLSSRMIALRALTQYRPRAAQNALPTRADSTGSQPRQRRRGARAREERKSGSFFLTITDRGKVFCPAVPCPFPWRNGKARARTADASGSGVECGAER